MLICMAWHRHWHLEIRDQLQLFGGAFPEFKEQSRQRYGKRGNLLRRITFATRQEKEGDNGSGLPQHGGAEQTTTLACTTLEWTTTPTT